MSHTDLSNCCYAPFFEETDICSSCEERAAPLNRCVTCKEPMDETEHNYGTEEQFCCINCYNEAQG